MNVYNGTNGGAHPAAGNTALAERNVYDGQELAHITDQTSVLAQQAVAAVQARYVLAIKRPRNIDVVRQNLLRECDRPGFAAVARYRKPIGKGIEGPSIRFAEAALRCMGNMLIETMLVSDTSNARVVRVVITELESNTTYYLDVTTEKVVERKKLNSGQQPLGQRHNSYGDLVYLVPATEDDLVTKLASGISKAVRTLGLRLLPGDILEECMERVQATMRNDAARDPDALRKRCVDQFAKIGVTADQLAAYLNRKDLVGVAPSDLVDLAAIYQAVRDGEATWADAFEASPHRAKGESDTTEATAPANDHAAKLREKMAAAKTAPAPASGQPATQPVADADPTPPETARAPQAPPKAKAPTAPSVASGGMTTEQFAEITRLRDTLWRLEGPSMLNLLSKEKIKCDFNAKLLTADPEGEIMAQVLIDSMQGMEAARNAAPVKPMNAPGSVTREPGEEPDDAEFADAFEQD